MSDSSGVVCHLFIQNVTIQPSHDETPGEIGSAKMGAVVRGEENKSWSHYTPMADFNLSTLNPAAFAFFRDRLGQEVEVTIRPLGTKNGKPIG